MRIWLCLLLLVAGCAPTSSGPASLQLVPANYYSRIPSLGVVTPSYYSNYQKPIPRHHNKRDGVDREQWPVETAIEDPEESRKDIAERIKAARKEVEALRELLEWERANASWKNRPGK
jgi:hypothetical protein